MYDLEEIKKSVENYGQSNSESGFHKEDFHVGDRVVCVGLQDAGWSLVGQTGTVKCVQSFREPIGIEFDVGVPGTTHNLDGFSPEKRGYFVRPYRLVIIPAENDLKDIKIGFDSLFEGE